MNVAGSDPASSPIALVRRGFSPTGGAEKFLVRFASEARKRGRRVILVTDRPWPESSRQGLEQTVLPGRSVWTFAKSVERWRGSWNGLLFSLERLFSADCYRAGDGVYAAWMQRRREFDPLTHVLLRKISFKHFHLLKLEKCCFSSARTGAVIVNSRMVAAEIEKTFGYPREKIHLVRNGLPADFMKGAPDKARARRELGLSQDGFVAAFAGTGWKRKGLRFAAAAMKSANIPGARLVVAGRGKQAAHLGADTVFLGPVPDVRPLLSAADVFILPTVYDPFSNACLEALAAGLPVITTAANGCSEVLRDGLNGSVVERPDDIKAMTGALRYWADGSRASAASTDCRAVADECSLEQNVTRTLEVLESVRKN